MKKLRAVRLKWMLLMRTSVELSPFGNCMSSLAWKSGIVSWAYRIEREVGFPFPFLLSKVLGGANSSKQFYRAQEEAILISRLEKGHKGKNHLSERGEEWEGRRWKRIFSFLRDSSIEGCSGKLLRSFRRVTSVFPAASDPMKRRNFADAAASILIFFFCYVSNQIIILLRRILF